MKKLSDGAAKHKRLFIFNTIALVIILAMIAQAKRGFFSITHTTGLSIGISL
jgi:hypothetical protein